MVDHTNTTDAAKSSLTQIAKILSQCPRDTFYQVKYIRTYRPGCKVWSIKGDPGLDLAAQFLVRDPIDWTPEEVHLEAALCGDGYFPRICPKLPVEHWYDADVPGAREEKRQNSRAQVALMNIVSSLRIYSRGQALDNDLFDDWC